MDENNLTQEQVQALWNEEAAKLDAGEPPADSTATAADLPPQDNEPNAGAATEPAEGQAEPAEQPPADPFEGLPQVVREKLAEIDAIKQANAQLLHHVKTTEGRVAAMQREAEQARRAQQQVAAGDAPSQTQMAAAAANPEEWEQLKQDFPEWAGAMEKFVAAKLAGLTPQQGGLTPEQVQHYVQQRETESMARVDRLLQEARIEGKYEDWREQVNTPEFAAWFAMQGPEVRTLADSPKAKDAIRMLDLFNDAKKRPAAEIRQERGARLAAAATVRPGGTPPPKSVDDLSPEELWNYEAKQRDKTRAQRGF